MSITLSHSTQIIKGEIRLTSSKSESNRALIIQALCSDDIEIENLSISDDTVILQELLNSQNLELDVNIAGTAMRFLTAFKAIGNDECILTGADRMKERPIKVLVDVLRQIGANIEYLGNDGFPPLKIIGKELDGGKVIVDGSISSQYISALLMIAPVLKNGIRIEFSGEIMSKSYINMTIEIMKHFGASIQWIDNSIIVIPLEYKARNISIEADWSAASYWYSMVSLAKEADVTLFGLKQKSLQGDSVVQNIYKKFGVETEFVKGGLRLTKTKNIVESFEYNFSDCPDIAQTVAVTCAALNVQAKLTGLKTLRIKETDRIVALKMELTKFGYSIEVEGDDIVINSQSSTFFQKGSVRTYNDHRMAMAFAPLALLNEIVIEDENVVAKSYPNFWRDLSSVKFTKN